MKKFIYRTLFPLAIIFITSYFYISNIQDIADKPFTIKHFTMDTVVSFQIYGDEKRAASAARQSFKEISRIEKIGEIHNKKSEIYRVNEQLSRIFKASYGDFKPIVIHDELSKIINLSLRYKKPTKGTFDPSIGDLIELWSIGDKNRIPSYSQIQDFKAQRVDQNIAIKNNVLEFNLEKRFKFDLGGVLKGYAVDKIADILRRNGINSALISTVSSTKTIGTKPEGKHWRVGIENPRKGKGPEIIGILKLGSNYNVSTSGDYQKYFVRKGKRYSHILDPMTGFPAEKCISVTVVTKQSSAEADILSTALFVMGYPEGLRFAKSLKNTEVLMVDLKGMIHVSKGFKRISDEVETSIYN